MQGNVTVQAKAGAHASFWSQHKRTNPRVENLSITDTETFKILANWSGFLTAQPLDHQDGRAGRVCSASGLWYPGSMIVYVAGLPYGIDLAPIGGFPKTALF